MTPPSADETSPTSPTPERRWQVIEAGFHGNIAIARAALADHDPVVRASALRALRRIGDLRASDIEQSAHDEDREVRRTAAEMAAAEPSADIAFLIDDDEVFVAEMAAWALGEREHPTDAELDLLIDRCTSHSEALVREACAASLGAIGDPRGLPAILAACRDKPAVRRRAVLALAPFEGPEVETALRSALEDRDWQVRQNAEDLISPRD